MKTVTVFCGMMFIALAPFSSWAFVDHEPGDIIWELANESSFVFYLDASQCAQIVWIDAWAADQQLIATHVKTLENSLLPHWHCEPLPAGNATTVSVKAFWDSVFLWPNSNYVTGGGGLSTQTNCYGFALGAVGNGTYNAWLPTDTFTLALQHDTYYSGQVVSCSAAPCIQDRSIINYGGHAAFIVGVTEPAPACPGDPQSPCGWTNSIQWKWRESGIYGRSLPQPYCPFADTATPHFSWAPGANMQQIRSTTSFVNYAYATAGGHVWIHK